MSKQCRSSLKELSMAKAEKNVLNWIILDYNPKHKINVCDFIQIFKICQNELISS